MIICAVVNLLLFLLSSMWLPFSGRNPDPKTLEAMVNESPGPLNFTMFLSLFGDKLKGEFVSQLCVLYLWHILKYISPNGDSVLVMIVRHICVVVV